MLLDRYPAEEVFARVPALAEQTDPVLRPLDRLVEDAPRYRLVRADLVRRSPLRSCPGRHSTPVEVILRLLVIPHLDTWRLRETEQRVADSVVLGWCCRVYCPPVAAATRLLRWAPTSQPARFEAPRDRVVVLAQQAKVSKGRKLRLDGTVVQRTSPHPTDSRLLVDGVRVLSRVLRRSTSLVGERLVGVRAANPAPARSPGRGGGGRGTTGELGEAGSNGAQDGAASGAGAGRPG